MTKHIRLNHDKTYTKKSWQNIYAHYDEEVLTKHVRLNHDKTYTKKSWQNIYDEIMTKHLRRSHENSWGEKRGEKTGEISPLHLNYIFGHLHSLRRSLDKTFTKKSWQIQEGRKEVRKEVRSNLFFHLFFHLLNFHDFFVNVLSRLHRNECKGPKNII